MHALFLPMTPPSGTPAVDVHTTAATASSSANDLLLSTPAPVLHLLSRGAPFLRSLTGLVKALTWSHPNPWAPWLVSATWVFLCLTGDHLLRWGVNATLLGLLGVGWVLSAERRKQPVLAHKAKENSITTPERFRQVVDDARQLNSSLHLLLVQLQPIVGIFLWEDPAVTLSIASYLATSMPFYLLAVRYVGQRYILLVTGLIALTWHARWAKILRNAALQSLIIRWLLAVSVSVFLGGGRGVQLQWQRMKMGKRIFSQALPKTLDNVPVTVSNRRTGSSTSISGAEMAPTEAGSHIPEQDEVIFKFVIMENQRWWVGLDWTQALLPSERPPWSVARSVYSLSKI